MSYCTVCGNGAGEINYAAFAGKEVCPACGTPSIERMNRFLASLFPDTPPEDPEVLALCEKHGFGAVMASASRQWRARDPVGAKSVGECFGTLANTARPDVETIGARANAATRGPWWARVYESLEKAKLDHAFPWADKDAFPTEVACVWKGSERGFSGLPGIIEVNANDGTFIAHAREDVPALIAYIRKLEARSPEAAGADKGRGLETILEGCSLVKVLSLDGGHTHLTLNMENATWQKLRAHLVTPYPQGAGREGKEGDGSGSPHRAFGPEIREKLEAAIALRDPEWWKNNIVLYNALWNVWALLERSSVSPSAGEPSSPSPVTSEFPGAEAGRAEA